MDVPAIHGCGTGNPTLRQFLQHATGLVNKLVAYRDREYQQSFALDLGNRLSFEKGVGYRHAELL
jgi:hypothetical protein